MLSQKLGKHIISISSAQNYPKYPYEFYFSYYLPTVMLCIFTNKAELYTI